MEKKPFNAFEMAQQQFDAVAEKLGLDPATRDLLRNPLREYHFLIPVRMDDGSYQGLQGLPRPAQRRPRPLQGRHPLPPPRNRRHRPRPGHVDDLEDAPWSTSPSAAARAASSAIRTTSATASRKASAAAGSARSP